MLKLRRATIVETRQTTRTDELVAVAMEAGLDTEEFLRYFENGSAAKAFEEDLRLRHALNIHSLPTCLIEYGEKAALVNGLANYEEFVNIIERMKA